MREVSLDKSFWIRYSSHSTGSNFPRKRHLVGRNFNSLIVTVCWIRLSILHLFGAIIFQKSCHLLHVMWATVFLLFRCWVHDHSVWPWSRWKKGCRIKQNKRKKIYWLPKPSDVLKIKVARNLLQWENYYKLRFNFNPSCLPVSKILWTRKIVFATWHDARV